VSTEASVPLLVQARAAFRNQRWDAAYKAYAEAREHVVLTPEDLEAMSDAAWWIGLPEEASSLSEEVHRRCIEEGQPSLAAMAAMNIGLMAFLRGRMAVGSGWLSRARRLLDGVPHSVEHGYLRMIEAEDSLDAGDLDEALEGARELLALGRQHGDQTLQSMALVAEGTARVKEGQLSEGLALLDEAMLAVVAGEVRPEFAGNIYCRMMALCHDLLDLRRAREWTVATQRWCDTFSSAAMFTGICRLHRAQLLVAAGEWASAEAEARRLCNELIELNVAVVGEAWYQIAELARLRGDHAEADAAFRRAVGFGRDPQPGLALLWSADGRPREALAALTSSLSVAHSDPFRRARLLAVSVEVALEVGDAAVATDGADALSHIAQTWPTPGFRALAAHARGLALLAADDPAAAVIPLRNAVTWWRDMDAMLPAAMARVHMARACAASGDLRGARVEAEAAHAALSGMGAAHRALEGGDPAATGGLTRREVEVLAMVAEGATNRQVAAALAISQKTVARHLANIYLKLGVSTRTAAGAWAHRHGIRS